MPGKKLNVALIGHNFMGKAHSHAWRIVVPFFEPEIEPVLKLVCGRNHVAVKSFAARWGWQESCSDWREAVSRNDIDIVDIATPTDLHHDIAVEAAFAGKHVFCEKPMSLNVEQAIAMRDAAVKAGVVNYLNHNYRRCPAVMLARQLIEAGKLGRLFHWRGAYLQSWITNPDFPLTWHLQKEKAGAGPHFDLNSHSIDLARFLVGEVTSVVAMIKQFVATRPVASSGGGAFEARSTATERAAVTVEDAAFMLAEFENGALGSFEASRFATGRKNFNTFEIYGSEGSLAFNLERMNEIQYFSERDDAEAQGFRTILATESLHPYMRHWWPPGHIIGYEHTFTHAIADFLKAIAKHELVRPDFAEGVIEMRILEAGLESARTGSRVSLAVSSAGQP
jgi:predicted dehydrogenase